MHEVEVLGRWRHRVGQYGGGLGVRAARGDGGHAVDLVAQVSTAE
ncbi:hypothetical protein ACGFY9_00370 [Streptomyces sp. NPDC048504]